METDANANHLPELLQPSSRQVWVQAIGRALYQAGYGVIQFYIPLIFVNQVGLSATAVGIGIGSGSLAGVLGHLLGGYLADSPAYGRKRTLLFSAGLSILSALFLVQTRSLPMLVLANLLLGLSAGCYWTAADAAVIDVTSSEQRHKAFAVMVLADSLGGGLGVLGGGLLLAAIAQVHVLFLSTTFIFLLFLVLVQLAVVETRHDDIEQTKPSQGFVRALTDRSLQLFVLVNVLFTTYIALVNSTLPLYFTKVMSTTADTSTSGSTLVSVANLFTWCYVGIGAVLQWPLVQWLNAIRRMRVLMLSMLLWCVGFVLVWTAGIASPMTFMSMIIAFGVLSIATAVYKPFAPAIVAELAPKSLRGIYLAISYQCWSIGYFIGPILGGWAMDQPRPLADYGWLITSSSTIAGLLILYALNQRRSQETTQETNDLTIAPDARPIDKRPSVESLNR